MCLSVLLLWLSAPDALLAQEQDADAAVKKPPVTSPYLALIRDPQLHTMLGIGADQRQAIQQITDEIDGPLWRIRASSSPEQYASRLDALIAKVRPRLQQIVTSTQARRIAQIEMQSQGSHALLRDDVDDALQLTPDQLREIVAVLKETNDAINERKQKGGSQDVFDAAVKKLKTAESRKLKAILSRDQQRRWAGLLGKPFDVSKLGRIKFKAPELSGTDGWINSRGLKMSELRGKVVALHFFAFG